MIYKGSSDAINYSNPKSLAGLLSGLLRHITNYLWPETLLLLEYNFRRFRDTVKPDLVTCHVVQGAIRLRFKAPWQQVHLLAATQLQSSRRPNNVGICSASTDYYAARLDFSCLLERNSLPLPDLLLYSSSTFILRHSPLVELIQTSGQGTPLSVQRKPYLDLPTP